MSGFCCTGVSSELSLYNSVYHLSFTRLDFAENGLDLYYEAFPADRLSYKCLVYGVYVFEFVQTILVTHDAFATFGFGFGDIEAVTNMHFNWFTIPIMSGLGKLFFIRRLTIIEQFHALQSHWLARPSTHIEFVHYQSPGQSLY